MSDVPTLYAIDERPANLSAGEYIGYTVTNDQWQATADPFIQEVAARQNPLTAEAGTHPQSQHRTFFRLLLVLAALMLVVVAIKMRTANIQQKGHR